jgi:hypothetical protein
MVGLATERERGLRLGLLIRHPSVWIKARGGQDADTAKWLHTNPQPLPSSSSGQAKACPPGLALVTFAGFVVRLLISAAFPTSRMICSARVA